MKNIFLALLTSKKVLTIFAGIFFICPVSFSQTGWINQTSGTSEHLQSVCFVNDLTGWTVGYSGKVLKTTNSGTNWISQSSGTVNPLLSVSFVNSLTGWAVGAMGEIIVTGNGGTTWTLQASGSTSALTSVYFTTAFTGWAVGDFMTILKTTNSGINWISIMSGSIPLNSVIFNSLSVGYIAGNSGTVMKSTNGGLNWTVQNSDPAQNLYSVHFPAGSLTTGYAVGMGVPSPPILKSTDSGISWTIQPVLLGNALNSVYFTNVSTGWAAGFLGTIMHTSNGGSNWSDQISNTSNSLRSIFFSSSATGWAVGDLGTIVKTSSGGITALNPVCSEIPSSFSLSQNYPNPFNPTTTIKFSLPGSKIRLGGRGEGGRTVQLKVYDIMGREVQLLVNEKLQPGTYETAFDATRLTSGIYFYKLSTEGFSDIKKMMLIK